MEKKDQILREAILHNIENRERHCQKVNSRTLKNNNCLKFKMWEIKLNK